MQMMEAVCVSLDRGGCGLMSCGSIVGPVGSTWWLGQCEEMLRGMNDSHKNFGNLEIHNE